jgi:hypothetical protein
VDAAWASMAKAFLTAPGGTAYGAVYQAGQYSASAGLFRLHLRIEAGRGQFVRQLPDGRRSGDHERRPGLQKGAHGLLVEDPNHVAGNLKR